MRLQNTLLGLIAAVVMLSAQDAPPDFSGVYYPLNPFGQFRGGPAAGGPPPAPRQGPPPKPTASAPLSDGSRGRTPDEPLLTPEYMAKWEMISKTRIAGTGEYEPMPPVFGPWSPSKIRL